MGIGYPSAYKQWGVSTTSFPLSVSEVYSINASKKDTGANSVPDVQNYSSTGFAYYGPSPYAWFQYAKLSSGDIAKVQAQYRSILLCSPLLKSAGIARLSLGKHQTAVIALSLIQ